MKKDQSNSRVKVDNIRDVSGEVNIAGGDIYKGFTAEQVFALLSQITSTFQPKSFDGRCPYKGLDFFEEEDAYPFTRLRRSASRWWTWWLWHYEMINKFLSC